MYFILDILSYIKYNKSMLILEREKLKTVIKRNGLSLNQLAAKCGVSRQSIYNMLNGKSVFNTTFEKILDCLDVNFEEITVSKDERAVLAMKKAPAKIQRIALALSLFAKGNKASLFLFGSRARGCERTRADWDFGVSLPEKGMCREFVILKQKLVDEAFPYRVDIVDVSSAPDWFIQSIVDDVIPLVGSWKPAVEKERRVA